MHFLLQTSKYILIQTKKKKPKNKLHRQLDDNAVMHLDDISLAHFKNLRVLRLEGNILHRVPTEALTGLPTLEIL